MAFTFYPIIVSVPTIILSNAVRIPLGSTIVIQGNIVLSAEGYLAALTSGPFTVEIRDLMDNALIGSLTWDVPGYAFTGLLDYRMHDIASGLSIAPTTIGVGAQSCVLTMWNNTEF